MALIVEKRQTFIYCLTNLLNGKRYIGQTHNLTQRLRNHRTGSPHCQAIHNAIKKYSLALFSVEVLYQTTEVELADILEQLAIAELDTIAPNGYNLRTGGETRSSFSLESIEKMRISARKRGISQATRDACKLANTGRKHSEATRAKMRQSASHAPRWIGSRPRAYRDAVSKRVTAWWAERQAS